MEKHYLKGLTTALPMMGKQPIMFDDVKNYTDTKDENGKITHFEFDDKDGHYSYTASGNIYTEDNDKAPDLEEFKVICRRTAVKHNDLAARYEVKATPWKD